jgi:AcrR family transcriptional regulator
MIWDEKKEKALELILENSHTYTDIAKIVGCSRQTLYEWENKEEFKAELTKRRQERNKRISDRGSDVLYSKYDKALNTIVDNIENGSPRNRLMAAIWWAEKIGGKPTVRHEVDDNRENKDSITADILEAEMDELDDI